MRHQFTKEDKLIIKIEATKATQILLKIYAKALHSKLHLDLKLKTRIHCLGNLAVRHKLGKHKDLSKLASKVFNP